MTHAALRRALLFVLILTCCLMMASTAMMQEATETPEPAAPPHWEYEGEHGPGHWGELDSTYAACSEGLAQSPIDISGAQGVDLSDITFNYAPSALNIFNNGHTVQVAYDAGSSILYNGITYDLIQMHFHHPSEHTVNGEAFAMELHLVHRSASGNLAVVGVLLRESETDNANYAVLFDNLPTEVGDPQPTDLTVDAASLLPESKGFFTYNGSLTTPPCSEIVRWLVLTEPVEVSAAQLEAFATLFENDARPVQPLNGRDLLEDTTPGN
ncbi:MAG: carbonic anhydrase [Anaerolineae bacterium]